MPHVRQYQHVLFLVSSCSMRPCALICSPSGRGLVHFSSSAVLPLHGKAWLLNPEVEQTYFCAMLILSLKCPKQPATYQGENPRETLSLYWLQRLMLFTSIKMCYVGKAYRWLKDEYKENLKRPKNLQKSLRNLAIIFLLRNNLSTGEKHQSEAYASRNQSIREGAVSMENEKNKQGPTHSFQNPKSMKRMW